MAHWHLLHFVVYYIVLVALLWLVTLPSHSILWHVHHVPTFSIPGSQLPIPYICNLWYLKVFWRKINKFNQLVISCLVLLVGNELYLLWKFQVAFIKCWGVVMVGNFKINISQNNKSANKISFTSFWDVLNTMGPHLRPHFLDCTALWIPTTIHLPYISACTCAIDNR